MLSFQALISTTIARGTITNSGYWCRTDKRAEFCVYVRLETICQTSDGRCEAVRYDISAEVERLIRLSRPLAGAESRISLIEPQPDGPLRIGERYSMERLNEIFRFEFKGSAGIKTAPTGDWPCFGIRAAGMETAS